MVLAAMPNIACRAKQTVVNERRKTALQRRPDVPNQNAPAETCGDVLQSGPTHPAKGLRDNLSRTPPGAGGQSLIESQKLLTLSKKLLALGLFEPEDASSNSRISSFWREVSLTGVSTASSIYMSP